MRKGKWKCMGNGTRQALMAVFDGQPPGAGRRNGALPRSVVFAAAGTLAEPAGTLQLQTLIQRPFCLT